MCGLFLPIKRSIEPIPLAQDLRLKESRPTHPRQNKLFWLSSQQYRSLAQPLCLVQSPCPYHVHGSCTHDSDSESGLPRSLGKGACLEPTLDSKHCIVGRRNITSLELGNGDLCTSHEIFC